MAKKHHRSNLETVVIGRETAKKLLLRILARVADHRVTADCRCHLDEMRRDPSYVPENITVAKMIGR